MSCKKSCTVFTPHNQNPIKKSSIEEITQVFETPIMQKATHADHTTQSKLDQEIIRRQNYVTN